MADTDIHPGYKHFVRVSAEEAAWGTVPETPSWINLPIRTGGYGIDVSPKQFEPDDNASGWQGPRRLLNQLEVGGPLNVLLYPEIAERVLNMCLDRDDTYDLIKSYTIQDRNPLRQRQHQGCMVNSFTIKGDHGGEVGLEMDIWGKDDSDASASFTEDPTLTTQVPYKFQDGVIELPNGTVIGTIENFTIKGENKLVRGPYYGSTKTIAYLKSTRQIITGTALVAFNVTTYQAAKIAGTTGSLEIVLTHPVTTTDGICTITVTKLSYDDVPLDRAIDNVVKETINWTAEIPDSGDQLTAVLTDGGSA